MRPRVVVATVQHGEVRRTRLFTWSLVQLGAVVLGALVIVLLVVGLVIWRRGRGVR